MKRSKTSSIQVRSKKPSVRSAVDGNDGVEQNEITQSAAFKRATVEAEAFANDPERLAKLLLRAREKINSIPRGPFAETWPYLMAMIRLISGYHKGEYTDISEQNLHLIIAATVYFVSPYDLIPDSVPIFGHLDDALVIRLSVKSVGPDLDAFMAWETSKV